VRHQQQQQIGCGLDQVENWVDHELNGYTVPGYRIKCCEQKVAEVLVVGGEVLFGLGERQVSPDR
jgi:hypothetical protein